jgi:hypothetical protein
MLDYRKILNGRRGKLYDDEGRLLAMINTWHAQVNITNTDYRPAGEALAVAIFDSYTVTLTFTETVIEDETFLEQFVAALRRKEQFIMNFMGVIEGHGNGESRLIFRDCTPDAAIDLANIQVGDIINRAWSWRVNSPPELQELLAA